MTQILIRNGVLRQISSTFTINAWDAAVNKDTEWSTTDGGSKYSTWCEYDMATTKNIVSVYSTTDTATQPQEFLPIFYQPNDEYAYLQIPYPLMSFNQEAALRYNGSESLTYGFLFGFSATVIARFESFQIGEKAFVISIGSVRLVGESPIWSYADIHVYKDASTNYDHLISRVGSSYKSTRITGWDPKDVHVYTITYDQQYFRISIDNIVVETHNIISTGGLWYSGNYSQPNAFWFGGDVGYLQLSDAYASLYTGSVGYHAIVYATYQANPTAGGYEWNNAIKELCQYRYKLPNPSNVSYNSTASLTLGSTQVIVFGSYNFDGTQQFL